MELIVVMNWRLDASEGVPDVLSKFLSCNCRIACSASSSFIPGWNDRCMLSVTPVSVVGPLQASQAAPAVGFKAKTASFSASTMTVDPSGSLFITKASEVIRSICILNLSLFFGVSKWVARLSPRFSEVYGSLLILKQIFLVTKAVAWTRCLVEQVK
jgi:hypothetical protein